MTSELEICAIALIILGIAFMTAHFAYIWLRPDCNDKDKRDL
jgi:hypothetical protein